MDGGRAGAAQGACDKVTVSSRNGKLGNWVSPECQGLQVSPSPHIVWRSYCPHPWLFSLLDSPCHLHAHTGEGDLPPSTRIQRGETCVHITFSPTLRDQSAFSSSGIMADFTIHYDVSMEDIIGDVQVPGPQSYRVLGHIVTRARGML
jgi:hypothetical protein